ncbi:hypothetical protein Z042_22965 [Chania multitudinisentens RB-25]|uniref:Uncharacterized protein n=1 Tax=Chania multitudinisentens RB-25 TaxID=1441930 RepID=W0LGK8_9GAMM|nr:hypothetical protein [Chania multitudinisentens]AHG22983.1 hypothetical protein Z042_22965 [Chania multitudinisentens RB-25]
MSQELALKFSSAPIDQLLSILPPEEVVDIIRERLRVQLAIEIKDDFQSRIYEAEEEASENYDSMETFKLSWEEAKPMLEQALEEHNPYEN